MHCDLIFPVFKSLYHTAFPFTLSFLYGHFPSLFFYLLLLLFYLLLYFHLLSHIDPCFDTKSQCTNGHAGWCIICSGAVYRLFSWSPWRLVISWYELFWVFTFHFQCKAWMWAWYCCGSEKKTLAAMNWSSCVRAALQFLQYRLAVCFLLQTSGLWKTPWLHWTNICNIYEGDLSLLWDDDVPISIPYEHFCAICNGVFRLSLVHNVEAFVVPLRQRADLYANCPTWWPLREGSLLSVSCSPIFAY